MNFAPDKFPKTGRVGSRLSYDRASNDVRIANMKAFCEEHKDAIEERRLYDEKHGTLGERFGVMQSYFPPKK
jgi:hypothetical protein